MKFELTEIQSLIQITVKEFAQTAVAPIAAEIDRAHRFPEELIPQLAELNLLGVPYPEEVGGAGADNLSYVLVIEELARVCASTAVVVSAHTSLGTWPIYQFGTEAQKEKYLSKLASGEWLGAFALTEPGAGTDAAAGKTTAVLEGDEWVLNGSKIFITNGGYADVYVVTAMTDPSQGTKGISAFIVDKDAPGFSVGEKEHKLGIKASSTTPLYFSDCRIPKEAILGEPGKGFKIAMQTLDGGRIGIAAQALGIAQGALDAAVKYAKERVQFGKPIANQQAIQWMIADMATQIEAARFLVYRAAWNKDNGLPYSKEAAMAKLYAAEAASFVANKAIQIHGGYGYTENYSVERSLRDAKITEIYEGTSEVQRMVIAGSVLR
ncbi:acyl-CoA dehydrogenase [Desulfitobacterium metallireducens]|uniref:Acyl-CoA dehydrogenase n=1 Tax=Desulfitobacterium metallireducens DSM 15288 TaxID=871968 RepID=W0EAW7_9FIRM|nr:acyl-CoA dehydrogenase [Desulfitobacterium metallireducens]AHF06181.1 acyl-CoA dehydrogenase [Desulfitobacterium metallireducens DSM 15288]